MAGSKWKDLGTGWLNRWKKHDPSVKNSPFFKGTATIEGKEMLMTGWIKQGKYGKEDQSVFISFTEESKQNESNNTKAVSLEDLF